MGYDEVDRFVRDGPGPVQRDVEARAPDDDVFWRLADGTTVAATTPAPTTTRSSSAVRNSLSIPPEGFHHFGNFIRFQALVIYRSAPGAALVLHSFPKGARLVRPFFLIVQVNTLSQSNPL